MSFAWIKWTNKFNDSISVNVKFGKSIYSFIYFIVRKRELPFAIGLHGSLKESLKGLHRLKNQLQIRYLIEGVILMEFLKR